MDRLHYEPPKFQIMLKEQLRTVEIPNSLNLIITLKPKPILTVKENIEFAQKRKYAVQKR